jgi:hypothetical protein
MRAARSSSRRTRGRRRAATCPPFGASTPGMTARSQVLRRHPAQMQTRCSSPAFTGRWLFQRKRDLRTISGLKLLLAVYTLLPPSHLVLAFRHGWRRVPPLPIMLRAHVSYRFGSPVWAWQAAAPERSVGPRVQKLRTSSCDGRPGARASPDRASDRPAHGGEAPLPHPSPRTATAPTDLTGGAFQWHRLPCPREPTEDFLPACQPDITG